MKEAKDRFTAHTIEVWQTRTTKRLTQEDARQITENMMGFFRILMEWEAAEKHTSINETNRSLLAMPA